MSDRIGRSWVATPLVTGTASGALARLEAPLSFWGGYDASNGVIAEPTHPQFGSCLRDCVVMMERGKGSSSSSSVLAESIRLGTGPAAFVMCDADLIIALGCIVASELYRKHVPVVVVDVNTWSQLQALSCLPPLAIQVEAGEHGRISSS